MKSNFHSLFKVLFVLTRAPLVLMGLLPASCAIVNTKVTLKSPICTSAGQFHIELKLEESIRGSNHIPFDYSNTSRFDAIITLSFKALKPYINVENVIIEQNSK